MKFDMHLIPSTMIYNHLSCTASQNNSELNTIIADVHITTQDLLLSFVSCLITDHLLYQLPNISSILFICFPDHHSDY